MPLMSSRSAVSPGDRYRQTGGGGVVWMVVGFAADHTGNQHARLVAENDGTRIIMISFAALQDRTRYEHLAEISEIQDDGKDQEPRRPGPEHGSSS